MCDCYGLFLMVLQGGSLINVSCRMCWERDCSIIFANNLHPTLCGVLAWGRHRLGDFDLRMFLVPPLHAVEHNMPFWYIEDMRVCLNWKSVNLFFKFWIQSFKANSRFNVRNVCVTNLMYKVSFELFLTGGNVLQSFWHDLVLNLIRSRWESSRNYRFWDIYTSCTLLDHNFDNFTL